MKKVALSLLAFALAGGMVSAQDALKLSGYLNTGLVAEMAAGKSTSWLKGTDAGKDYGRIRLNGTYGSGNTGVTFRLQTDSFGAMDANTGFGYAWAKFPDFGLSLKAGKVDDGSVSTQADLGKDLDDKEIAVFYTGVPGLAAAAAMILPTANTASTPLKIGAQAKYTVDQVVSVVGGAILNDFAPATVNAGVGVLAVPGLTLGIDTQLTSLNDKPAEKGTTFISIKGSYVVDALTINLLSYIYTYGADVKAVSATGNAPLGFYARPGVSYAVDKITSIEGRFKYAQGTQGGSITSKIVSTANDVTFVEPQVIATFALSSAAKIATSYTLSYSLDKDKLNYGLNGTDKDPMKHSIYVDFIYSF